MTTTVPGATPEQVAKLTQSVATLQEQVTKAQEAQRAAEARELLNTKLAASKLPQPAISLVREHFADTPATAEQIDAYITKTREAFAAVAPSAARVSPSGVIQVGLESVDKMQAGMDRLFGVTHEWEEVREFVGGHLIIRRVKGKPVPAEVPPFAGIRKAYEHWTGDYDVSGVVDRSVVRRITEEWNSTSFVNALNNSANKRMIQDYAAVNYGLEPLYDVANAPNFKTQEIDRIGYLPDLSDVDPEAADYAEIAAPTDEKITYALGQKGNILTVTRKMIINDDLGVISKRLSRLARSAARTLAQHITDLFINNAAIYDGTAWFHADHGNLGSTALAIAELLVIRAAFRAFTEKDSLKKLNLPVDGLRLMVPVGLAETAKAVNEQEYKTNDLSDRNMARYMFGQNSERIIVNPLLADATDYYVLGDKNAAPYLEVAFLNGRVDPIFTLQDDPGVDKVFTADRIRLKVLHEYKAYATDFRNTYKEVVA